MSYKCIFNILQHLVEAKRVVIYFLDDIKNSVLSKQIFFFATSFIPNVKRCKTKNIECPRIFFLRIFCSTHNCGTAEVNFSLDSVFVSSLLKIHIRFLLSTGQPSLSKHSHMKCLLAGNPQI